MVPAASTGDPPTPAYSGTRRQARGPAYGTITPCGAPSHALPQGRATRLVPGPTTPAAPRRGGFGLFRFRSPLLAESLLFSPPPVTLMFQFHWLPSRPYGCG